MKGNWVLSLSVHTNWRKCLHYFLLSENVLNYKIGTKMFYVAYRPLLVGLMFCVLKYYFVDFNGMFTSFQGCQIRQGWCALQSWENIIFQNKTFLVLQWVMFYRQNKTFWYQFCNFKHFLKAENSEDSLASSWHSKPMVSSVTLLVMVELSDCSTHPNLARGCSEELHYDRLAISLPLRLSFYMYLYSEGLYRILRGLAKFTFLFTYVQQWSQITVYANTMVFYNLPKLNVKVIRSP